MLAGMDNNVYNKKRQKQCGEERSSMKKLWGGIVVLCLVAYLLCGCAAYAEQPAGIVVTSSPIETPSPMPTVSPLPTPSPVPAPSPALTASPAPEALPFSPVYEIDAGELLSVLGRLPNTEGYEAYLKEDLVYHDAYINPETGDEYWSFDICLPSFAENMPCYRELNRYFEQLYARLLSLKDAFYEWLGEKDSRSCYEEYIYTGMSIGGQYLTVYMQQRGYYGGIRDVISASPVTFDLTNGRIVTLPELLGCTGEQVRELVADYVYEYFLSQDYLFAERDTYLWYDLWDFYMLEQGLGVYYPRYAIDCGAAGDFLFVIPYDDLYAKVTERGYPTPKPLPPVTEISVKPPSTEGYEAYLEEDIVYHDAWRTEKGVEEGLFDICLPQFGERLPCYGQINAYFVQWSADELDAKDTYYAKLEREAGETDPGSRSESLYYEGMSIGERYLTVYTARRMSDGKGQDEITPMPVTFDLDTGQRVNLWDILDCVEWSAASWVDDQINEYLFDQGNCQGRCFDIVWFQDSQFYMLEQGMGVYYAGHTIDFYEGEDSMFLIPYEKLQE